MWNEPDRDSIYREGIPGGGQIFDLSARARNDPLQGLRKADRERTSLKQLEAKVCLGRTSLLCIEPLQGASRSG